MITRLPPLLARRRPSSVWVWWPPGPRPKQAALYPRRLWLAEAIAFAFGIEIAVDGALAGSRLAVAAGGVLLVAAAVAACAGALLTLTAGRPALRVQASVPAV